MNVIRRLPDDLANQIAAGEVVERPASVAKELVENAIDARATRIRIDVEGGGVGLIRVSDDGVGMSEDDAPLAAERHATSKIAALDDLLRIESYGFRGEAIPSIASVSRFTLRTRRREDEAGTEVLIEGGGPMTARPCGVAPGTVVEVRDLFFNVPARRKFLRSLATESAHVTDVAEGAALAAPDLTVVLAREGRVVREWLRAASRAERVTAAFADEELAPCAGERGPFRVEAYLSRPERARAAASALTLFVNGRPVRDRALLRAVAQAYGSVLEPGRYPLGVVYLELDPSLVDVNVHPQKAEVRFADGRAVGEALFRVLADELARAFGMPVATRTWNRPARATDAPSPAPVLRPRDDGRPALPWGTVRPPFPRATTDPSVVGLPWSFSGAEPDAAAGGTTAGGDAVADSAESPLRAWRDDGAPPRDGIADGASPADGATRTDPADGATRTDPADGATRADGALGDGPSAGPMSRPYPLFDGATRAARAAFGELRFLAQVRQTYLVCEGPGGLYVLDQHAAAERVTFDRLRKGYAGREIPSQALLFPVTVEVSARDAAFVEESQAELGALGLDVRVAGMTTIAVYAMPRLLARAKPEDVVRDLVAEATREGGNAFSKAVDLVLATMACHGSVRAGDRVLPEEATALLAALDQVDFSGHCPHGRPIVTALGWDELDRKVGRR